MHLNALLADFNTEISVPQNNSGACLGQATTVELSLTNHNSFSTWLSLQLIEFSKLGL